jgi:hypothetical protein
VLLSRDIIIMELVIIHWVDIESNAGWIEDPADLEPPKFSTVGWLRHQDDTKVVISDTFEVPGSCTVFPLGCIEAIETLEGPEYLEEDLEEEIEF